MKEKRKTNLAVEKFFGRACEVFFDFHKSKFTDQDGYPLRPNWDGVIGGMERRNMKLILKTLREINEGKGNEWTEDLVQSELINFFSKAYNDSFIRKNFTCAMMYRYRFNILSSNFNPTLAKKIKEWWYFENKDYTVDQEKDNVAAEIIVNFLKSQFVINQKDFTEEAMIQSWRTIIKHIKSEEFWSKKSLKSISNHMQEFVNKIKSSQNGNNNLSRIKKAPVIRNKPIEDFGDL